MTSKSEHPKNLIPKKIVGDPMDGKLRLIVEDVLELLLAKHHDYGRGNLDRHGVYGILVRVDDKTARIKNLLRSLESSVETETIKDTWRDIAGYAIQAIRLIEEGERDEGN